MKQGLQVLETETFSAVREWTADDVPVLRAEIFLPRPADLRDRAARRIHRFYQLQGASYLRYCENWLAPKAAADFHRAAQEGAPLPFYTARLTYRVTCNEGGFWSLHTDSEEFTGSRPLLVRRGDTWDLRSGYPVSAAAFFPRHTPIRRLLLKTAAEEIRRQEAAGTALYADGWPQRIKRSFQKNHFYITPDAFCFFWQMLAIAPAAEGIPTFSLPFSGGLCRLPGPELCKKGRAPQTAAPGGD